MLFILSKVMAVVHALDFEGINISSDCLAKGTCSLSIYNTLKIREEVTDNSAKVFVQDIFLSATFFIGSMAVIWLIVSGMLMVFGGGSESMYEKGKKWFKYSIIGLLLVIFSYTMIRVVEYIAQGRA